MSRGGNPSYREHVLCAKFPHGRVDRAAGREEGGIERGSRPNASEVYVWSTLSITERIEIWEAVACDIIFPHQ